MSLEDIIIASELFKGVNLSAFDIILIKIGIPIGLILIVVLLWFIVVETVSLVSYLKDKKRRKK